MSRSFELKPVARPDVARAAIRDVKNLASYFRGLISLADELGEIADLQTFTKEEEQRLAHVQGAIRSREAELEKVAVDLVARREEATAEIAQLESEVAAMKATLKNRSEIAVKIIDDAKAEANRIVLESRDDARSAVATEVEKIKAKLNLS